MGEGGEKVLVAGAGGRLGAHLIKELASRGFALRALVRGGTATEAGVETFVADAREPGRLKGACDGVGVVVSAMGASLAIGRTRGGGSFREVDLRANLNLLEEARRAGARKFVYVSLYGAERLRGFGYVDAHEEFVSALAASGLARAVVRPTGFFYVFEEFFKMARRGRAVLIGDGRARTNPVDERDVARACADAAESKEGDVEVGGPEVFTRREIIELAFASLGKRPKITSVPPSLLRASVAPVKLFDRRLYDLLAFGVAASTVDLIAPKVGSRRLGEFFRALAAGNRRGP